MSAKVQTPPPMPLPTLSSTTPNRLPRPPRPTSLASRHRAAPYHVSRPAPSPPPQKQNGVGQASSVQDSGAFQTDFQDAQSSLLPRATGNVSTEAPTGGGMANQDTVPAWLCDRCKSLQGSQVHCVFCPLRSGAMRPLSPKADVWAHVVCARYFDRGQDPVALAKSAAAFSARSATCVSHGCASGQHHHVQGGEDGRTVTPRCYLCPRPAEAIFGSLLSCASQTCPFQFHASCAHSVGLIQFDSPSSLSISNADGFNTSSASLQSNATEVAPAVPAVFCHQHARQKATDLNQAQYQQQQVPEYLGQSQVEGHHLARNPWFEWSMQRNQCTAQPMSPRYDAPALPPAPMDWSSDEEDDDNNGQHALASSHPHAHPHAHPHVNGTPHSHPHLHPMLSYGRGTSHDYPVPYLPPQVQPQSHSTNGDTSASAKGSHPPFPPPIPSPASSGVADRRGSTSDASASGRRKSTPGAAATSPRPANGASRTESDQPSDRRAKWDRDGSLSPLLKSSRASSSLPGAVSDSDDGGDMEDDDDDDGSGEYEYGSSDRQKYKRRRRGSGAMSMLPAPAREDKQSFFNVSASTGAPSAAYPPPTSPTRSPGRRDSSASAYDSSASGTSGAHRAASPYNPVSAAAAAAHHQATLENERVSASSSAGNAGADLGPICAYNSRLQPLPEVGADGLEIIQLQPLRLHRDGSEFNDVLAMHESYVPEAKPGTELARGELRFPGDLYTPLWKRGTARNKEAMCRLCPPEQWFCVKISAYWYHLHFLHGVSSATGVPFTGPVAERYNADLRIREGQCHKCNKWVPLDPARPTVVKVPEIYWWKHAQKCHSKK